jgi:hypothetical protein
MTLNSIIGSFGNSITYNILNRAQSYSNLIERQNKSITYFFYLQRDFFYQFTDFRFQRDDVELFPEVLVIFEVRVGEDGTGG